MLRLPFNGALVSHPFKFVCHQITFKISLNRFIVSFNALINFWLVTAISWPVLPSEKLRTAVHLMAYSSGHFRAVFKQFQSKWNNQYKYAKIKQSLSIKKYFQFCAIYFNNCNNFMLVCVFFIFCYSLVRKSSRRNIRIFYFALLLSSLCNSAINWQTANTWYIWYRYWV